MKGRKSKSWAMAYCGMAAALSVVLMLLGAVFPIAMFIAPAVASFLIATVCVECGKTMALTAYGAVSLLAAEPKGNLYGALYSVLATDDPNQRKSMHYIGSCIGRAAYLLDKAESFSRDKDKGRYNVFLLNGINDRNAARENARRQALAAVNDLVRAYGMLDVKLNRTLLDNIMILGLRHAIEPLDVESQPVQWELP